MQGGGEEWNGAEHVSDRPAAGTSLEGRRGVLACLPIPPAPPARHIATQVTIAGGTPKHEGTHPPSAMYACRSWMASISSLARSSS